MKGEQRVRIDYDARREGGILILCAGAGSRPDRDAGSERTRHRWKRVSVARVVRVAALCAMIGSHLLKAQSSPMAADASARSIGRPAWDWGFQATTITQTAPSFHDPYEGERSFRNEGSSRAATTLTTTLFTAASLWRGAWVSVQPEFSGGAGVGEGQGIAAFPNLDVVRVPSIASRPYIARAFIQQTFPLGEATESYETPEKPEDKFLPGGNRYFGNGTSANRLIVTFGKVSLPDFFDTNNVFGDAHHRLANWGLGNNGAWDYAADTRGYTWGLTVALEKRSFVIRMGTYAMPAVANGPQFDHHLRQAHGENLELEWTFNPETKGVIRALGFVNHARMGNYDEAIAESGTAVPDITGTRRPQRRKIGWGINAEQGLGKDWSVAVRVGWDDGKTESFAYTEIDRTASLSTSCSGSAWGRPEDRVVVAVVVSGLSSHHRRYLEAGGVGFQVGDGRLRYGEETIVEADYAAAVNTRTAISLDLQRIGNPGFNRDRGPITVYGLRVHFHR